MSEAHWSGPLDRGSLVASLAGHALVLAFVLLVFPALEDPPVIYETVAVDMVALASEPEEVLVVETPDDPPPVEDGAPVPDPDPEPEADTAEVEPPAEDPAPSDSEESQEVAEPDDGEDMLTQRVEAFRRDYPEYFQNITNWIERCFRWQGSGRLEVAVTFKVLRDGRTIDMEVATPSGSHAFDQEALGAVECAGMRGRLGTLPEEYPYSMLPVHYTFTPRAGVGSGE